MRSSKTTPHQLQVCLESPVPVLFTFITNQGDQRTVLGTRNLSIIPEKKHPKTNNLSEVAIRFFDYTVGDWRSISIDNKTIKIKKII
jgi:hypothetical protein